MATAILPELLLNLPDHVYLQHAATVQGLFSQQQKKITISKGTTGETLFSSIMLRGLD